ncbi:MAG: UPF0179 family protein [Promethearchaeota archaeon]
MANSYKSKKYNVGKSQLSWSEDIDSNSDDPNNPNIKVSLVGKSYAKKGFKFYFSGPRKDICPENCKFFNTCMLNLKPKTIYEVVEVTEIEHKCPMDYHLEPMVLVKLKEADIEVVIDLRLTFEGAVTTYKPIKCDHKECPYYPYCSPVKGLPTGSRVKIIKIIEKIKNPACHLKNLTLVRIKKLK